ncbi:metallophosphoesterase family protein [Paenibacillus mendelii]|uniref:Metallophosphoesterase family protein n=1 Tax=Paenibacillus mendelii TaxID=206163 RepID=A0ABV6J8L0_9BACL|nr:metallophosphoesterase family protein [Paenibacillus mendelii]MCQ6559465.1 metallophosphoesterase family protein [Paenibacillus mendelii]
MGNDLKFNPEGSFTIVQFTDMHIGSEEDQAEDAKTRELVLRIIEAERPDLIVLTGDMIWSHGVPDPAASFRRAIAPVAASGIPWAAVYGNHDSEGDVTREELLAIQQESATCLTQAGPGPLSGVGNFVLTVKDRTGEDAAAFYFLDSGAVAPEHVGGYEWIHTDQVHWYTEQSRRLSRRKSGPLPALGFFHIPLQEYADVWSKGTVSGQKFENVEAAKINSGLFSAMVEMGDMMGTFVGHDHDNDYCGTLHGIQLCYGRVTGYNTYGRLKRGARVIRLTEGKREFDTWIREDDGMVVR